jgi:SAM-dependent methyltransferase
MYGVGVSNPIEINRLKRDFGWNTPEPNSDGVRRTTNWDVTSISNPGDTWDDELSNSEGLGIWSDLRVREIASTIGDYTKGPIWEVGAGNGTVSMGLSRVGFEVVAIEPLYAGAKFIAKSGVVTYCATLESLDLPDQSVHSIGIFDVLEHIAAPNLFLSEISRVLDKKGFLFIAVPAHQWLFSDYDTEIGHFRRYSKSSLEKELLDSGFDLLDLRFMFSFLVPIAWALRVLPKKFNASKGATMRTQAQAHFRIAEFFAPLFRILVRIEKILRVRFGLSIVAVAKPKTSP